MNVSGLTGEELAAVNFFGGVLGKVDTAAHSAQELSSLIRLYCGSMSFDVNVYEVSASKYRAEFTARVSAIESKLNKALGLLGEILTSSLAPTPSARSRRYCASAAPV